MTKTEFINLISFCILMENNKGILAKAPRYVLEKWETRQIASLDKDNTEKLNKYKDEWPNGIARLED